MGITSSTAPVLLVSHLACTAQLLQLVLLVNLDTILQAPAALIALATAKFVPMEQDALLAYQDMHSLLLLPALSALAIVKLA